MAMDSSCRACRKAILARPAPGFPLAPSARRHIARCAACARLDHDLAGIGAELRQALGRETASIPHPDFRAIAVEASVAQAGPPSRRWIALAAAASVLIALGVGLPSARARSSHVLVETRTRELVEELFGAGLLEGAELSAAASLRDPPPVFDRDGELFLRSSWSPMSR